MTDAPSLPNAPRQGTLDSDPDCYTIIGRFDDSGEATVTVVRRDSRNPDPHWAALHHLGEISQEGEFELVALLRGRCDVLVTQQSLRLFCDRILAEK